MRKPKIERPEEQQRFETFLRSRQLKLTGERLELVEEVFGQAHHFDADQLHMALKQKGKAISRATVYRTLDLLVQPTKLMSCDKGPFGLMVSVGSWKLLAVCGSLPAKTSRRFTVATS